jgi:hypothetical protein
MTVLNLRAGPNVLPQPRWGWTPAGLAESQVHQDLEAGALWRAPGDQRWRVIICRRGVVWITQKRDAVDYLLREGEILIVTLPGLVLVQAFEASSVTVVMPSARERPGWSG